ncbi:O-acyltransferase [Bacteroidia bacterium]|nr:O-acyltransferase [Bacteroidia bacterium]
MYYFVFKEKTKSQNVLLLVANYFFYAWVDWRLLPLLIVSTLIFYGLGIAIFNTNNEKRKSLFCTLGVVFGLGVLGYFKYVNFFITSLSDLFESLGLHTNWHTFKILVPIGISFYTFRLLSYVLDIHREECEPTRNFVAFATYVAFFPCILSGPIDRPNKLIPQIETKRIFNYSLATDGLRQILWGLFKKMVIADNCAGVVDRIWENYTDHSGSTLALGAILCSIQVYADFSGYTDMAIGIGKLLGFRLTKNFNYPFFSKNIADYWKKWHISLTSWLTDYVFTPLNFTFRKLKKWGVILAVLVNFTLVGLWHGANWNFVAFGVFHGLLYIPLILSGVLSKEVKIETGKWGLPQLKDFCQMLLTFFLVVIGGIIFKSGSIAEAWHFVARLFSFPFFSIPVGLPRVTLYASVFSVVLIIVEWIGRHNDYTLERIPIKSGLLRLVLYAIIVGTIIVYGNKGGAFIYFQF